MPPTLLRPSSTLRGSMSFLPSNVVVVDDRDRHIWYSEDGWTGGGIDDEFMRTTQFATRKGATASFMFTGTSANVYGTINPVVNSTMSFKIDDGDEHTLNVTRSDEGEVFVYGGGPTSAPGPHALLYQFPTLTDSGHTLVITQQTDLDVPGVIFLDYITYVATPKTPRSNLVYLIDDRDTRIQYNNNSWKHSESGFFLAHGLSEVNASECSFQLDFQGTGVALYGPLNSTSEMIQAEIAIDNQSPIFYNPSSSQASEFDTELWSMANLQQGSHTLRVTLMNNQPLRLDYILVQAGQAVSSIIPSSDSPPAGRRRMSAGAIAGIVVGSAIRLALIGCGVVWFIRRRRNTRAGGDYSHSNASQQGGQSTMTNNLSYGQVVPFPATRNPSVLGSKSRIVMPPAGHAPADEHMLAQHVDSGVRIGTENAPPPTYTAN